MEPEFLGLNSGSAMDYLWDLGELLTYSVILQNRDDNDVCITGLLWELFALIYRKGLELCWHTEY